MLSKGIVSFRKATLLERDRYTLEWKRADAVRVDEAQAVRVQEGAVQAAPAPDPGRDDWSGWEALLAGGAAGVLTVLDGPRSLESVAARRRRSGYGLAGDALGGDLEGFVAAAAMDRVLGSVATTLKGLEAEADRPGFQPRALELKAKVDGGKPLEQFEVNYLEDILNDLRTIKGLVDRHPEYEPLVVKGMQLYTEITTKALQNEQK